MFFRSSPDEENYELAKINLAEVSFDSKLIKAAVGATDKIVRFKRSTESNLGSVSESGDAEVRMLSMNALLDELPESCNEIDLLKIDIEGGEQELLSSGDLAWLRKVRSVIIEFHPDVVDYPGLVHKVQEQGFRYLPAGTEFPGQMDFFIRE